MQRRLCLGLNTSKPVAARYQVRCQCRNDIVPNRHHRYLKLRFPYRRQTRLDCGTALRNLAGRRTMQRKATELCRASHSTLRDRTTLTREEPKQREPSYEYHRSMATFMAPDSHFIWCFPVIRLGSHLVLVVVAFCRMKSGTPRHSVPGALPPRPWCFSFGGAKSQTFGPESQDLCARSANSSQRRRRGICE